MGGAAAGAAGAMARARRRLVSHFMSANATSSATAVGYEPERGIERRILAQFIDKGVIHQAKAGTYWLDLPAYDVWHRSWRRRAGLMVGAAVAVSAALGFLAGS